MSLSQQDDLRAILPIDRRDFARVTSGLFVHLFGLLKRPAYLEYVGDKIQARATLRAAKASGYLMRNCKLYAYACWHARANGTPVPKPSAYNVNPRDALLLRRLNLRGLSTRFYPFTLNEFERMLGRVFTECELDTYIGKYVSKQMRFLLDSYGVKREELEGTMLQAAVYAAYRQYPRYESFLHVQNICKTTIHNTGQNLIQYHTRAKRQALRRKEDGSFEAVNVSMAALLEMPAAEDTTSPLKEAFESLVALEHKMTTQVRQFLMCAAGQYDEGLSRFLGKPNDDVADVWPYTKYLDSVRQYFNVSEQQTEALFARLRPHLV